MCAQSKSRSQGDMKKTIKMLLLADKLIGEVRRLAPKNPLARQDLKEAQLHIDDAIHYLEKKRNK